MNKSILCIDLKSFFASCECVKLGLDPYKVSLVVASSHQGNGAITLAITPFLKSKGIKSRSRLYEIPSHIQYKLIEPNYKLYEDFSKKVVNVFLEFVSSDDLHVYSIDECFLDLTNYLKFYKKSDYEMAEIILDTIFKKTGLTATCGIGPTIFCAKVAMDIEAKKHKNGIVKWSYENYKDTLLNIYPLKKIWGIGNKLEKKLNNMGIYTSSELADYNSDILYNKIGLIGVELKNELNLISSKTVHDLNTRPKDKSISISEVLMKDYDDSNIHIIIEGLCESISYRLRKEKKLCSSLIFGISYSKSVGGSFNKSLKLKSPENNLKYFYEICMYLFEQNYNGLPIRKVEIHLHGLTDDIGHQLNLFEETTEKEQNIAINKTIDNIKSNHGLQSINKASSLLNDSSLLRYQKKHTKK